MNHTLLATIVISMFIASSCKKDSTPPAAETGIGYPDSIYYNKSVLTLEDSAIITGPQTFGFAANLGKDANLSIRLTDLSAPDSLNRFTVKWEYAAFPVGWLATRWQDGTQKFTATQTGKIDLQIHFDSGGDSSTCRLDFYENSTNITKTKYLLLR